MVHRLKNMSARFVYQGRLKCSPIMNRNNTFIEIHNISKNINSQGRVVKSQSRCSGEAKSDGRSTMPAQPVMKENIVTLFGQCIWFVWWAILFPSSSNIRNCSSAHINRRDVFLHLLIQSKNDQCTSSASIHCHFFKPKRKTKQMARTYIHTQTIFALP